MSLWTLTLSSGSDPHLEWARVTQLTSASCRVLSPQPCSKTSPCRSHGPSTYRQVQDWQQFAQPKAKVSLKGEMPQAQTPALTGPAPCPWACDLAFLRFFPQLQTGMAITSPPFWELGELIGIKD